MLDRFKDWKTTILGLLIAAVIIAALLTRPTWDAADFATFIGGVAAAIFGAWARSSAVPDASPKAPTAPPLPALRRTGGA